MTTGTDSCPLVSIQNASKMYTARKGVAVQALEDVTLDITEGEFITLVGPSGCGKSTLLRMIAGLHSPTTGKIELDGIPHTGPNARIGIVYQQPLLLPWKSVLENVLVPIRVRGQRVQDFRERAEDLLEVLGLADFAGSFPHQLSGGMQQRVSIARALIQDPEILLMDEPFGALDAMTRDQLTLELIRIQQQFGKTVIFVTHSIQESVLLADRVVAMTARPGRIARVFAVDLPRPRSLEDVNSESFGRVASEVRAVLDQQPTTKAVA